MTRGIERDSLPARSIQRGNVDDRLRDVQTPVVHVERTDDIGKPGRAEAEGREIDLLSEGRALCIDLRQQRAERVPAPALSGLDVGFGHEGCHVMRQASSDRRFEGQFQRGAGLLRERERTLSGWNHLGPCRGRDANGNCNDQGYRNKRLHELSASHVRTGDVKYW